MALIYVPDETYIVDDALKMLKRKGIVSQDAFYDKEKFENLRTEVKNKFDVPGTSISPVMERLLYMLSSVKMPKRIIAIGISCGNTLIWNVGSSCCHGKVYEAEKVYGVDINRDAINIAKKNFNSLLHSEHVELIAENGHTVIDKLHDFYDYVYFDADNREMGKRLYLTLLKRIYSKLKNGAWVLAHDTTAHIFREDFKEYLDFVRNKQNFSESISFDVDHWGLEVSIR